MNVCIFTFCYSPVGWNLFEKVLLPSMREFLAGPVAAARNVTWRVYTTSEEEAAHIPAGAPAEVTPVIVRDMRGALLDCMRHCVKTGSVFLMAPPDTYFGKGSLDNLLSIAANDDACICGVHVRVLTDEFLAHLEKAGEGCIANDQLVKTAFSMLHASWSDSFASCDPSRSFHGGVVVQRLAAQTYVVQHHLPTCHLARFTPSDLEFFRNAQLRDWDWVWPNKLFQENRYRYVGSSDVFFAVECTGPANSLTPLRERGNAPLDQFEITLPANHANRCFYAVLRAAE